MGQKQEAAIHQAAQQIREERVSSFTRYIPVDTFRFGRRTRNVQPRAFGRSDADRPAVCTRIITARASWPARTVATAGPPAPYVSARTPQAASTHFIDFHVLNSSHQYKVALYPHVHAAATDDGMVLYWVCWTSRPGWQQLHPRAPLKSAGTTRSRQRQRPAAAVLAHGSQPSVNA